MNLRDVLSEDEYKNLEAIAYNKSKSFCYLWTSQLSS